MSKGRLLWPNKSTGGSLIDRFAQGAWLIVYVNFLGSVSAVLDE